VAEIMGRKVNAISRQLARMEKDGLVKKTQLKPKSNLLRLELTDKGVEILNISTKSKENTIDAIMSFLTKEQRKQMETIMSEMLNKLNAYSVEKL
jgi:DNA-binding MarR family transcriptional regulator